MIDVSPYIQKMEWLKEWIEKRIDGKVSPPIYVNMDGIKFKHTVEAVMRIYRECGVLFSRDEIVHNPMLPFSFDEYCNYKQSLLK